jgi:hypothetical protein
MENYFKKGNFFWVLTIHYKNHSETSYFVNKENAKMSATEELFDNEECTGCSIHKKLFDSVGKNIAWKLHEQTT